MPDSGKVLLEDYEFFLNNSSDAILITDTKNTILRCNQSAKNIFGISEGDPAPEPAGSDSERGNLQSLFAIPDDKKEAFIESVYCNLENKTIYLESHIISIEGKNGKIKGYISVIRDITDRKQIELKYKHALKEKEVLLKELFHRTRNNMSVIYSLLGLQKDTVQDDNVKNILEKMKNRIMAISLVHKKLYEANNLSNLDLKDYISDLVNNIVYSYCGKAGNINVIQNIESIVVLIDTAIPVGMIINELINNSLKHGFPCEENAEITISLKQHENDVIELIVSDNGTGIPDGGNLLSNNTIGGQLIRALVEQQLEGSMNVDTKNGVKCSIIFTNNGYTKRV